MHRQCFILIALLPLVSSLLNLMLSMVAKISGHHRGNSRVYEDMHLYLARNWDGRMSSVHCGDTLGICSGIMDTTFCCRVLHSQSWQLHIHRDLTIFGTHLERASQLSAFDEEYELGFFLYENSR
jgi:hypothetical protein